MFSSQVFESALSITMFVLRILVPLLSTVVLVRCFVSKTDRGRRKEEPVVLLEDLASGLSISPFYIGKTRLDEAKAATSFYLTVPAAAITLRSIQTSQRLDDYRHQLQSRYVCK